MRLVKPAQPQVRQAISRIWRRAWRSSGLTSACWWVLSPCRQLQGSWAPKHGQSGKSHASTADCQQCCSSGHRASCLVRSLSSSRVSIRFTVYHAAARAQVASAFSQMLNLHNLSEEISNAQIEKASRIGEVS